MNVFDWRGKYASKVRTVAQAIGEIAPAQRILIASGAAEPVGLVEGLIEFGDHLQHNEIIHLLTLGPAPYVQLQWKERFRHCAFFIGSNVREAVQEGRADFIPVFLSEIPELIRSARVPVDVALIQIGPPDKHGFASLGVSVDIVKAAVQSAKLVIAQVNRNMPRTHGDSFIRMDEIDFLVPMDAPLLELPTTQPGVVHTDIGRYVASLVPNGATLQTGIGEIPNAVLAALSEHRDLGLHTEMFSDGVMKLAQSGVMNGARKSFLPGKLVTSFIMGTADLYEWIDDHPAIEMRPSDFVNDPAIIAQNDAMISINSALAVDLTGQVASDTIAGRFFSGIGGQVDFVRGASRSRGGKSIIALPSTAKNGTLSRIQASFQEGAGVVTSRGDVHFVVTEYGIADLWGKTIRERAMSLIAIAHPTFRSALHEAACEKRYFPLP